MSGNAWHDRYLQSDDGPRLHDALRAARAGAAPDLWPMLDEPDCVAALTTLLARLE